MLTLQEDRKSIGKKSDMYSEWKEGNGEDDVASYVKQGRR